VRIEALRQALIEGEPQPFDFVAFTPRKLA